MYSGLLQCLSCGFFDKWTSSLFLRTSRDKGVMGSSSFPSLIYNLSSNVAMSGERIEKNRVLVP